MQGQNDRAPMLGGRGGDTPQKFNATWKGIFFGCAVATTVVSLYGLLQIVASIIVSPFDIIIFSYLMLFGLVMCVMDAPISHPYIEQYRMGIYKFCLFLTRFIGRGITYMFLGSMLAGNLWDLAPLLGFGMFVTLVAVSIMSIRFGIVLTKKLNMFRSTLRQRNQPPSSMCPAAGLTMVKFGDLALATCGITFTQEELGYIANALSQTVKADDVISQREFEYWLQDSMPVLI